MDGKALEDFAPLHRGEGFIFGQGHLAARRIISCRDEKVHENIMILQCNLIAESHFTVILHRKVHLGVHFGSFLQSFRQNPHLDPWCILFATQIGQHGEVFLLPGHNQHAQDGNQLGPKSSHVRYMDERNKPTRSCCSNSCWNKELKSWIFNIVVASTLQIKHHQDASAGGSITSPY